MAVKIRKKIIIVDLSVMKTSPAGSCVLSEIVGLSKLYEVHLISNDIDEALENLVVFHRMRTIRTPLVLRYVLFSLFTHFKLKKLRKQLGNDIMIQSTQGQYPECIISYTHFCHTAYLSKHWKNNDLKGIKRPFRKLNHYFNSWMEEKAFSKAKKIVVPSPGLGEELLEFFPKYKDKVQVLNNPIDVDYFKKPPSFDKKQERITFNIQPNEIVISFMALGDFARKGLSHLMHSLVDERIKEKPFKILVVGGKADEIKKYLDLSETLGIEKKIIFMGFKSDVRPYLWMSDIFSLPSLYETFSLVAAQAAAAQLPLLMSHLHGVEEYLIPEKNGWIIKQNAESIATVLAKIAQHEYDLPSMGSAALQAVKKYDHQSFRDNWASIYKKIFDTSPRNQISDYDVQKPFLK